MTKSSDIGTRTVSREEKPKSLSARITRRVPEPQIPGAEKHMDHLVVLVDHCTAAKDQADALGETFLSYLLAMTIQEGRATMRRIGVAGHRA